MNCQDPIARKRQSRDYWGISQDCSCLLAWEAQGQIGHHKLGNVPKVQSSSSGFWQGQKDPLGPSLCYWDLPG